MRNTEIDQLATVFNDFNEGFCLEYVSLSNEISARENTHSD